KSCQEVFITIKMWLICPGMNPFVWMYRSHFTDAAKFWRSFPMQLNQLLKVLLPRIRRGNNPTKLDIVLIERKSGDKTCFIYHACTFLIMPAGFDMHHLLNLVMPKIFLVICRQIRGCQVLSQANGFN